MGIVAGTNPAIYYRNPLSQISQKTPSVDEVSDSERIPILYWVNFKALI